jgi:hypothetical protein
LALLRLNPELQGDGEAELELGWIEQETPNRGNTGDMEIERAVERRVRRRSLGEPLQYILGQFPRSPVTLQDPNHRSSCITPRAFVTAIRWKYRFDGFRTFDLGMPCAGPDPSTGDGGRLSATGFTSTRRYDTAG